MPVAVAERAASVADARLLDRVEEDRVLGAAARATVVADAEDVRHGPEATAEQVHVPEDDAESWAASALERLAVQEARGARVVERDLDDVEPVALRHSGGSAVFPPDVWL